MPESKPSLMVTLHQSYFMRGSALVMILLCIYLAIFWGIKHLFEPKTTDYYVAFGIAIAGLIISASMSSHLWVRFMAPTKPHLHTDRYQDANATLQELASRAGFQVELRVIDAKRMFIYSSGVTNRLVLISSTALESLSPTAMRGVLAHEVAHMVLTHAIKNACALASFFALRICFQLSGPVALLLVMWLLLYLRSREYEADKVAALMVGREPVITALHEVKAGTKMKEFSKLTEFLISTHPSYRRRELALRATQF